MVSFWAQFCMLLEYFQWADSPPLVWTTASKQLSLKWLAACQWLHVKLYSLTR